MPAIDLIQALINMRRRSGAQALMPIAGSGGSTNTRHGGGGGAPAPTHTDVTSGTGYGGGGGVPSGGGVVTGGRTLTTPAAVAAAAPVSSSTGYSVPNTVALANAITPQRIAALTPQILQNKGATPADKPHPRLGSTMLDQLDRPFGPGEQITPRQASLLAEAFGLPGKTYAQIAKGESSLQPGAVGHDPGGTTGLGLWQMTPGVQSPETKAKWDQIAKQHPGGYLNPVANAQMASYIAQGGSGVSNYYGTGFVTDPNAHVRGGQQRAQRVLGLPGSPSRASGGPYVDPFGKNIQIGRTDMGIDPYGPGPIRAIGRAKYLGQGGSGWPTEGGSGTGPVYKLLAGPQQGKRVYTYEGITPRTDLQPGDILHKGETIARSTGDDFETGFAQGRSAGFQPLAAPHYSEGDVTAEGSAFRKFVDNVQGKGGSYPTGGAAFGTPTSYSSNGSITTTSTGGFASPTSTASSGPSVAAQQQRAAGLSNLISGLHPLQSSLSQNPLAPRTRLDQQDQQDQQDPTQALYDLLYGGAAY